MSAGEEALSLFGELDGLFAPEMIATTPAELVQLVPGDHVAAMRAELSSSNGGAVFEYGGQLGGPDEAGRLELAAELEAWRHEDQGVTLERAQYLAAQRRLELQAETLTQRKRRELRELLPNALLSDIDGCDVLPLLELARIDPARAERLTRHPSGCHCDDCADALGELDADEEHPPRCYCAGCDDRGPDPERAAVPELELGELVSDAPAELLPPDAGRPACVHCGQGVTLENPETLEDGDVTRWGPLHDRCSAAFELEHQGDELEEEAELEPGPLVVIPCSGAKLGRTAPAGELYVGTLYRLALKAARAMTTDDRIRIFSARHGLVSLETELAPYEQKITTPAGRVDWHTVRDHIRALPAGELVLLLPNDYAAYFADPVRAGHVWRPFRSALAGCPGIHEMRHRLSQIAQVGRLELALGREHPALELVGGIDTSSAAVILERLEAKTTPAAELVTAYADLRSIDGDDLAELEELELEAPAGEPGQLF